MLCTYIQVRCNKPVCLPTDLTHSSQLNQSNHDLTCLAGATCCYCDAAAGEAQSVIVLTETEFIAIDLTSDGWPLHRVPYLLDTSVWSSVTSVQHATAVSDTVWNNIVAAGIADVSHWSSKVCLATFVE